MTRDSLPKAGRAAQDGGIEQQLADIARVQLIGEASCGEEPDTSSTMRPSPSVTFARRRTGVSLNPSSSRNASASHVPEGSRRRSRSVQRAV